MNSNETYENPAFDYRQILLIHLRNMSALLTARYGLPTDSNIGIAGAIEYTLRLIDHNFVSAVEFMQSLISPYYDKEYKKDVDDILESYKGKKFDEVGRELGVKKLGAIIRLMDRLELLLERSGSDKV